MVNGYSLPIQDAARGAMNLLGKMSPRSKDDSLVMGTRHQLWTTDNYTPLLEEVSDF